MTYTVLKLITNAYYTSGKVARGFQTVTGEDLAGGLDLLNDVLGVKTADSNLIPYYQQYQFTAVPGQESYFIPNLIDPQTLTFNIASVRYAMQPLTRVPYFGSGRIDNIESLPFNWHMERGLGGSTIFLYFLPQQNYPMTLWGKFGLTEIVDLSLDLSTVYDRYYITYLRYALAEYICAENNITLQSANAQKLAEIQEIIANISPPDMSVVKVTQFQPGPVLNLGDVNFGRGWRPGIGP